MSAFIREIPKTLGVLPIDIAVGSKTSLLPFFVINSISNYNVLIGRNLIHANWCVLSSFHQFFLFWKGNEVVIVMTKSLVQ